MSLNYTQLTQEEQNSYKTLREQKLQAQALERENLLRTHSKELNKHLETYLMSVEFERANAKQSGVKPKVSFNMIRVSEIINRICRAIQHPEDKDLGIVYNEFRRWGVMARGDDEVVYGDTLPLALRLCDLNDEANALEYFCRELLKMDFESKFPNNEEW